MISQHAAADFFHPVVAIYPDIEAAYLAVIKSPMDLSTLANYLQENSLIDEEDYYEKVRRRFSLILFYVILFCITLLQISHIAVVAFVQYYFLNDIRLQFFSR